MDPTTLTPAERVALLIKKLDVSTYQFGKATGISHQTLSNVLAGKNKPGLDTLQAIAAMYPAAAIFLLTGEGEPFPQGRYNEKPAAQLPPPVPSKLEPSKPELPVPGEATPIQADFVGRLISQLEQENARKDALIEWLQEQNAQLLKKPLASSNAAAFMVAEPATPISLRPKACQPTECVVRPMWGPGEEAGQKAA